MRLRPLWNGSTTYKRFVAIVWSPEVFWLIFNVQIQKLIPANRANRRLLNILKIRSLVKVENSASNLGKIVPLFVTLGSLIWQFPRNFGTCEVLHHPKDQMKKIVSEVSNCSFSDPRGWMKIVQRLGVSFSRLRGLKLASRLKKAIITYQVHVLYVRCTNTLHVYRFISLIDIFKSRVVRLFFNLRFKDP